MFRIKKILKSFTYKQRRTRYISYNTRIKLLTQVNKLPPLRQQRRMSETTLAF